MATPMDPRKLDALHRRGVLGLHDVVEMAIRLAVEHDPASFADVLPPGALQHIEFAARVTPEERIAMGVPTFTDAIARETAVQEGNRVTEEGLFRWRDYFARADAVSVAPPGLPENG